MRTGIILKSLIQESKDGEWGKGEPFELNLQMAVIRGTDFEAVRIGNLVNLPTRYIPSHIANRKTLHSNDILLETAGSSKDRPTGRSVFIKPSTVHSLDIPLICASFSRFIRIDPSKANPKYIFWHLQYLYNANHLRQYHTQHTGVARFQYTVFSEREELLVPLLPIQNKIAAILSNYDRLIENNTRRIKILEEMARSLYDEWFVKFRFPGHEQVKMVDSELGLIPEGWEVKSIGEIIETIGGGTPSTKETEYWENGDLLWYTPSDLTSTNSMFIAESEKKITALGLKKSSARMFPSYSVMMTSRATIGVVALNSKEACTNQGFITCIPNNKLPAYQIYFWILNNKDKIISLASGATFKEINKTTFRSLPIIVVADNTRESFIQILNPVCKQIENLQTKNKNLHKTRALLLPKLIFGEIDVENLDIETEATA